MYGPQNNTNIPIHMPGLIVVDGPIGAGKTTFIGHLRDELVQSGARVRVVDETIPENLEEYYKDPTKNVFDFQKTFVLRLFDVWRALFVQAKHPIREYDYVICDRYWASTRAFVNYHRDRGNISAKEHSELTDIINLFITLCPLFPEYYIFINETSTTCLERIAQRGRPGETTAGDKYMRDINEYICLYNAFPFLGEGGEPSSLLQHVDKGAARYAVERAVLGRAAQQVKVICLTGVVENTTRGVLLPEHTIIDVGKQLSRVPRLTIADREFLMEEAALVAASGRPSADVLSLRK